MVHRYEALNVIIYAVLESDDKILVSRSIRSFVMSERLKLLYWKLFLLVMCYVCSVWCHRKKINPVFKLERA